MKKNYKLALLASLLLASCSEQPTESTSLRGDIEQTQTAYVIAPRNIGETGGNPWDNPSYYYGVGANSMLGQTLIASDVNNDGFEDLLATSFDAASDRLDVYLGNGSTLTSPITWNRGKQSSWPPSIAVGDFCNNFDGVEIIKAGVASKSGTFYFLNVVDNEIVVSHSFATASNDLFKRLGTAFAVGDWNGDGTKDLAVMARSTPRSVHFFSDFCNISADAELNPENYILGTDDQKALGDQVILKDLNGDGRDSLILVDAGAMFDDETRSAVTIYDFNDASGQFELTKTIQGPKIGANNCQITKVDFIDANKDGNLDMVFGCPKFDPDGGSKASGYVGLMLNSDGSFTEHHTAWSYTGYSLKLQLGSSLFVSDINQDGYQDLVVGGIGEVEKGKGYAYLFMGIDKPPYLTKEPFWTYMSDAPNRDDSYGYSLTTLNIDNQGWKDLAVSAMDYSHLDGEELIAKMGRLDVFTNSEAPCWNVNRCWIDNTICLENGEANPANPTTGDEFCASQIQLCDTSVDYFHWTNIAGSSDGLSCGNSVCSPSGNAMISYSCSAKACMPFESPCANGFVCRDNACLGMCLTNEDCVGDLKCISGMCTTNGAPIANAGPDIQREINTKIQLDGTASSDPDGDPLAYRWTFVRSESGNTYELVSSDQPTAHFTTPSSPDVIVFSLEVSDGKERTSDEVVVTVVNPPNKPPVAIASADPTSVPYGGKVTLSGTSSYDPDNGPQSLIYSWLCRSENLNSFELKGQAQDIASFIAPNADDVINCSLTVSDGVATSKSDILKITVFDNNEAPIANAGEDTEILVGDVTILDGSQSSDPDGDDLEFKWEIIEGTGSLSDSTSKNPTFLGTIVNNVTIQLTVSDGKATNTDTVRIIVKEKPNTPPIADAGKDIVVFYGDEVFVSGAASSDPDGDKLLYTWSVLTSTAGNAIELTSNNNAQTSFKAPLNDDTITLQLVVDDGRGGTAKDEIVVSVTSPNYPPEANAGDDQNVFVDENVTLDASKSTDKNGDTLTYLWTQIAGLEVSLSDPTAVNPTFSAPSETTEIVFELTVSDGKNTAKDTITITVDEKPIAQNHPPVVTLNVFDDSGNEVDNLGWGQTVYLDGSLSYDEDGDNLGFAYSIQSGEGELNCEKNSPYCTLIAPKNNTSIVVMLEVYDGKVSTTSTKTLVVSRANQAPIADAGGEQRVDFGTLVTVPGNKSYDPDGDALSYEWYISENLVSTDATYTFTAGLTYEVIELTLVVSDGIEIASDTVQITVGERNTPPVIKLADKLVRGIAGETVILDASKSSDVDGDALSFTWVQTAGATGILSDDDSSVAHFTIPENANVEDTFQLEVTVYDGYAYAKDTVTVYVYEATVQLDAPIIKEPAANALVSSRPQFSGVAATADGTVRVFEKDNAIQTNICTAKIKPDLTWSCLASFDLQEGQHQVFAVQIIDGTLDQSKTSQPLTFEVDAAQIEAPVILNPANGDKVSERFIVTGQAALNSGTIKVELVDLDKNVAASCTTPNIENGVWSCPIQAPTKNDYILRAIHKVEDNYSEYSENVSIYVMSTLSLYAPNITNILWNELDQPETILGDFSNLDEIELENNCKLHMYHEDAEICSTELTLVGSKAYEWTCDVSDYSFPEVENWISTVVKCGVDESAISKEYRVVVDPLPPEPENPSAGLKGGLCSATPITQNNPMGLAPFLMLAAGGILLYRRRRNPAEK